MMMVSFYTERVICVSMQLIASALESTPKKQPKSKSKSKKAESDDEEEEGMMIVPWPLRHSRQSSARPFTHLMHTTSESTPKKQTKSKSKSKKAESDDEEEEEGTIQC